MSIWKLVSGIFSIVFSLFVTFQSCVAGVSNVLRRSDEISGTAGFFVAMFMLAGGIVSIVTRKSEKVGGNIALIVIFSLASLIGLTMFGSYKDLIIWSGWCVINMILAIIALAVPSGKKSPNNPTNQNAN